MARFEGQGLRAVRTDDPDLKYRKYALPEEGGQPGIDQTQPTHRGAVDGLKPGSDQLSDHGPSQSKMGSTMVGMSVADIEGRLPPGFDPKKPSSRPPPPSGNDDPVDLPMPMTPPWMVGLWLVIAVAVVGAAGYWLLRP